MLPVNDHALAVKRERDHKSVHRSLGAATFGLAAVLLAGCATMMPPPQTAPVIAQDPSLITQGALREAIAARKAALKPAAAKTDAVVAFYEIRDFRPAWSLEAQ